MSGGPDDRLQRLLGDEQLADLRRRLRRHFAWADSAAPSGTLRLSGVSAREYETLAGLMGRRPRPASSILIDIGVIDEALRRSGIAPSLKAALEFLDGPVVHLPTVRAEAVARWAAVTGRARHPDLARLLETPAGRGLLKRLARQDPGVAERLCERADLVLQRLPASGQPRAQLAAEALGDAHALDNGQPAATLVLAVLRRVGPLIEEVTPDLADEDNRTLWARAGVLVNELARPALVLNVPVEEGGYLASEAGEPAYVSLRRLLRSPPGLAVADRSVYVCENPNVVAIAADRLGARCAPLVCTDGMPAAAQRALLGHLARGGASLFYHGDFDWPGLRIANHVTRAFGAQTWRLGIEDYKLAVHGSQSLGSGQSLDGSPTVAVWDASLAPAMQERGLAVPEEAVAAVLLQDLES
jgi:uncharacterized protein (TIGR02679 family)